MVKPLSYDLIEQSQKIFLMFYLEILINKVINTNY